MKSIDVNKSYRLPFITPIIRGEDWIRDLCVVVILSKKLNGVYSPDKYQNKHLDIGNLKPEIEKYSLSVIIL